MDAGTTMVIQSAFKTNAPPARTSGRPEEPPTQQASQDLVSLGERVTEKLKPHMLTQLGSGDKVVFQLADGRKVVLENPEGGPKTSGWFGNVKEFITAAAQEVGIAVNAGPNLALSGATELVKPVVLTGVGTDVVGHVDQWYQPAVRGVSIAISLKKFWDRWQANQNTVAAGQKLDAWDKVGIVSDGLHVLTSSAGLIGAVGGALFPSLRGAAAVATGVALAGDIGSFAVNGLEYINKRAEIQIVPIPGNPGNPDQEPPAQPPTP